MASSRASFMLIPSVIQVAGKDTDPCLHCLATNLNSQGGQELECQEMQGRMHMTAPGWKPICHQQATTSPNGTQTSIARSRRFAKVGSLQNEAIPKHTQTHPAGGTCLKGLRPMKGKLKRGLSLKRCHNQCPASEHATPGNLEHWPNAHLLHHTNGTPHVPYCLPDHPGGTTGATAAAKSTAAHLPGTVKPRCELSHWVVLSYQQCFAF